MNVGLSGTNVARNGVYAGWHGESWATPGGMLFPAQGLAMASLGGHLYAVGGNNGTDITSNQVYDPVTGTWGLRTAMPTARQGLGATVAGRKLYAIGGIQGAVPSSKNEVYDPEADVWTSTIPMPTARYGLGVAAVDGKIYTLGGNNGGNLNNNEVYDVDAGVWSSKTPFTGARTLCAAASLNGKVFLLGGDDGSVMNVVDVYDPRVDSWGTAATLLTPRRAAMAAVLGGKIFLLGGETPALTTAVEEFDYTANTWTARSPLPTARAKSGAAALEGRVHIAGGNDGAVINTHTIYDPGVAVAFKSLTPNTQYSFSARARNRVGVETGDSVTVSTYTLAVATAPFAFTEVFESSITVSWSDGGGGPGASFEVQASTMSNFVPVAGSSFTRNLFAGVEGLSYRNTTYYFRARAYNTVGETDYSWTVLGATSTAAELPTAAVPPFTSVQTLAISPSWAAGNNPVNRTTYTVVLSTTPSFDPADAANVSISTLPEAPAATLSASFLKNTTYYLLVSARNHNGLETPYALLGATSSLAGPPSSFAPPGNFPVVYESSVSVRWIGGGNPVNITTYTVALSTGLSWPNTSAYNRYLTTAPAGSDLMATISGLAPNTTYYARVWALNHNGVETSYVFNDSTATLAETPRAWGGAPLQRVSANAMTVSGTNWSSPSDIASDDDRYATYNAATQDWLRMTNWGFSVPPTSDIKGIEVIVQGHGTQPQVARRQFDVAVTKDGTNPLGTAAANQFLQTTDSDVGISTAGASWGQFWTPAEVNAAGFGVMVRDNDTAAHELDFDSATVRVSYAGGTAFSSVGSGSMAVWWSAGNNAISMTTYTVVLTTSASYPNANTANLSISTTPVGAVAAATLSGVFQPDTTYYLFASAKNQAGVDSAYALLGSTCSRANGPGQAGVTYPQVWESSMSVQWWGSANPWGTTTYRVILSTVNNEGTSYPGRVVLSTQPQEGAETHMATLTGLAPNSTYYLFVTAYNRNGVPSSGVIYPSTVTRIESPTDIYFDEVSTRSITASAYAPGTAFSSMTVGVSGVNVAVSGLYQGWKGEAWTSGTSMTQGPRSGVAVAGLGGRVFAVGGFNGSFLTRVESFDPVGNVWTLVSPMTAARERASLVAAEGRLYAIGGSPTAGTVTGANEEYDPESDSWSTKRTMPTARQHAAAGYLDGVIYVAGGCGGGCPGPTGTTTTEAYSIDSDTWVTRSAMNTPHARLAGAATGGKFYAVGGFDGSALAVIEEFDPGSNAWTTKTPMPTARGDLGVAAVGGKVFAVGGSPTTGVVEVFDPGANSWSTHSPMPTPRYALGLGSLRGKLYAVGGTNGSALATVEVFDPGVAGTVTSLTPNTLYTFKAKARNSLGTETAESPTVSTYTMAAATVPQNGDAVFSIIGSTEATVVWSSGTDAGGYNGAGATYLVQASTMTNFIPVAASSTTGFWFAKLTGLEANATNYFRVKAYNSAGVPNDWFFLGSTVTLANPPATAVSTFTMVGRSSMTVAWDANGNGAGTTYQVSLATGLPFSAAIVVTTTPYGPPSVSTTGLSANTPYFPVIVAINRVGVQSAEFQAGSTVTRIETPTSVYIDEVSSIAITASAYAPGPAFSSMTAGLSGTNVALAGAYAGWRSESWASRATMTFGRERAASVAVGGKVLVIGGAPSAGVAGAQTEEYDPVGNSWVTKTPMNSARYDHAVGYVGGRVIAAGGSPGSDTPFASVESYDPSANSWSAKGPLPSARTGVFGTVLQGSFYLIGGINGSHLGTNEVYDYEADSWTARAAMPTPRRNAEAVVLEDRIHVIDGYAPSYLGTHEAYDPRTNSWTPLSSLPVAHGMPCAGVIGGKIHAVGGDATTLHHVYDLSVDTWAAAIPMPTPRHSAAGTVVDGRLYCSGGYNGSYLTTHERYDPGVASSFTALAPNTLYSFKAKARNQLGVETEESPVVSTYTLAVAALPAGPVFTAVYETSATVNWSDGGGGPGASFLVQAATTAAFLPVTSSVTAGGLSATLAGLSANSTAYFRVRAYNAGGMTDYSWFLLGSTVTSIEAASSVYLDEVTTHSIVAAAYAAAPAFSSMTVGLSGTNLFSTSLGGYAGWKQESWTNVGPVPAMTARNQVSGAVLGGKLYAIGGSVVGATGDTQEYDPVTNGWTLRNSAMTPRNSPAVAVLEGRIYAVGGENAGVLAAAERYDPVSNAWSAAASLPQPRKSAVAAVWQDRLYLIGGSDGAVTVGDVWSYDAGTDTWTARSTMPTPRAGAAAAALDGKIYVLGGAGPASTNQVYDPATDLWAYRAPMLSSRTYVAAVRLGGRIVVAGGDNGAGQVGDTEEYDVAANTWTRRGSTMPLPRYNAAAGALGGRLFVAGGWNTGTGTTAQTDVFDPGTTRKFSNLTPNTLYFFKAKTRNSAGVETGETTLVSTYTLAVATTAGGATFNGVYATSATVNWSGGANGAGASFAVEASTMANYLPIWSSMTTGSTFASFTGLLPNSTHYFRVRAYNSGGMTDYSWFVLGSTVTAIETPTAIYFDEVSSNSITASAYAPGAAFSSMTVGLSGTNIARDGLYQGWNSSTWTARADMLVAKQALSGTALGGRFYAIRGDLPSPINEEYDPVTNSWAAKAVMSVPRYRMGVAGLGGKLYAVGGYNGSVILDANEVYDPESDSWSPRRPMPSARWALEAVAVNGLVYAIGGGTANEAYDPVTDTWTTKAAMSPGSSSLVVTAVGGKIYAVGGSNPGQNKEYDTATDVWTDRANLPTPRTSLAGASAGGKVYILGGSGPLKTVERFDPATNTWATLPNMPTGRSGFAAAAAGGKVYSYGGYAGADSKTMEMFDPGTASSFTALTPNTLYTFKAKARNSFGTETAESPSVSTYTLAAAAGPVSFPQVFLTSITVSWSNGGGGPDASYVVQASTMADFLPVAGSSTTRNLFATLDGLTFANSTYYFRILPYNKVGATDFRWFVAGSTVTAIETPTAVYFDEISSNSITASAYAPTPAFSNLAAGLSGTNIAKDGVYAGWHGESWTSRAVIPTGRHNLGAAELGGRIYAVGGNKAGNRNENQSYDPVSDTWDVTPQSLPFGQTELGVVAFDGLLYMVGGYSNSNQVRAFDPAANSWTARANLGNLRWLSGTAVLGGKIFAVSGANGFGSGCGTSYTMTSTVEAFDPATGLWSPKAALPGARMDMGTAVLGGKLYVFDGCNFGGTNAVYDPVGDSWGTAAAVPVSMGGARAAVVGGKAYYIGGAYNEEFDAAANAWTQRKAMPTSRTGIALAAFRGRIYALGGSSALENENEEYDPGTTAFFPGLLPNTLYTFNAKSRNSAGVETGETAGVSTYTAAAVPAQHANPFPQVFISSVQVQWLANNNPFPATPYRLHASTASDFNVAASSAVADWDTSLSTFAVGLAGNTTYYFRVQAKNFHGVETGYLVVGQAATTPFPPASAASTFSAVLGTSLDLSWDANGNGPATLYEAVLSTQPLPNALTNVSVTTRPAGLPGASVPGLISNATYYAAVRAISHSGAPTAFTQLGSTVTRVNPPVTAASTFSAVYESSFTAAWGGNGNNVGTRYEAVAATSAVLDLLDPAAVPVSTDPYGAEGADFTGLSANTTYYLFVAARARTGELTAYVALGSTVTRAAVPATAVSTFSLVESSSMTVHWSANGNTFGTRYTAVLTTQTPLTVGLPGNRVVSTDAWGAPSADMSGLTDNTTYFLFVRTVDRAGDPTAFAAFGSTVTDAASPSEVYFDAVSSVALVAVASGPAGGYANLGVSSSAVNFSSGGVFLGWVSGSSVAFISGLTPNTTYTFSAKARNQVGTETPESPSVSTITLAAVPSSTTPSFTAVWESSAAFQWLAGGNPAGTEFEASASTDLVGNGAAVVVSTWQVSLSTAFSGLLVNATYYFQVRARNYYGEVTAYRQLGSTVTGAAVPSGPAGAASTFTAVGSTYMTVNWDSNGNPAGTQYLARLSTSASFGGGALVLENAWTSLSSDTFVNLSTDTVYYAAVKARNHSLAESDYHYLGSTTTPVAPPVASTQPFPMVGVTSATFQWGSNGNPTTTLFEVEAATSAGFSGWTWSSGLGAMLSTTSAVLEGDTTYYWRVRAKGSNGGFTQALILGATQTNVADPQSPALRSAGPSSVRLDWGTGGNREAAEVGPWSFAQQLPQARERHGAAWVNGRVYVVGGVVSGVSSAEVWSASAAVDGTLGSWRAETSLPAARQSLALAVLSGRLYVLGGFDGVARKTVYFAPVGADGVLGNWTQTTDLPAARYNLAAAADGGWLYALGGDNGIVSQATVYAAPVSNDGTVVAWTTATALPGARNSHAAAAAGGRVFVAGGLGAGVASEVWSAPLSGASVGPWTTGAPLATPVFRHALVATPGALVALGGHDGTSAVATVQAAAVDGAGVVAAWGMRTPLAQARLGHAAVLDGKALLVFGGTDGAVASSSVELSSPTGTEYLAERALDVAFTSGYGSSTWRAGAAAELGGLTPNRSYFFQVRSRSRSGALGPPSAVLSTVTLAAVPTAVSTPFSAVEAGSATVSWGDGGNFAGTQFLAALSTAPNFAGALLLSDWTTGISSTVFGLSPNTTYYAVAAARNSAGTMTPPVYLGSTVTAAAVPFSVGFDSVQAAGFSVFWSTAGNPAGTLYEVQASTALAFDTIAPSTVTASSATAFSGLLGSATYYLRVRAYNSAGTASAFSVPAATTTGLDLLAPAAVTDLTANPTAAPGTLLAAWTITGDDGSSGVLTSGSRFYVQWAAAPAASVAWSTANAQVSSSTGPAQSGAQAGLVVTGLPVGSWVSMRMWTLDEVGNVSGLSNAAYALVSPFALTTLDGSGTDAGRGASVALDRAGNAHAAYTAGTTSQELRYMTRSGGVWSVAEAPDPGTPAADARIAVASGTPQVVYRNPATGGLRIARRRGSWTASAVAAGNLVPGGLALDATGFAHVSYYDAAAGDLRYARFDGTAWQTEPVDAAGDVGRFSSLVLTPSASPAVAYYDSTNKQLKYSTRSAAGVWSASVVDSGVDVGSTPVLGMGADESARIAYIDSGSKLLKFAAWSGAAWTIQTVDSFAGAASVGGLAFDGAGNPLVSYHDAAAADLRLARWTGTGWSTGTLASFGGVGRDSDLQVESDGGVTVLFYDASAGDLGSATWAGGLSAPLGGNPRGRLFAPASFSGVVASSITVQWLWTDSVDAEAGWRIYGGLASTGPFSLVASTTALPGTAGTGSQLVYNETNLVPGSTYYRYAVAVASSGFVFSPMAQALPVDTSDVTPPTIIRNQTGDAVWRKAGGALYDVDFIDPGGSGLAAFSVKASTRSGGAGPDLIGYTAVASGGLGETYSADWALPAAVFSALLEGATNYISILASDGNGNSTTLTDAFFVLKDTTAPTIDNYQAGGDTVPRSAAGTLYDVDAVDTGAGLERFQYSVSTAPLAGDGGVLGWTDIPLTAGTTGFTAGWPVSFAPLLSGASNFVSVRAIDRAGSTTTVTDAFFVRKDTTGPNVAVSTPPAGFPSAMGSISGTATDPSGVAAVQISIQTGGLWWNGSIFASVPQTWLTATGTAAWTYSSVPVWADGTAYRVVARASDTVGNFSTAYSTVDFTLDSSSPGISVTIPAPGAVLSSLASISGTAADSGAGLDWIRVSLRRSSDAASWDWNASSWSVAAVSTTPAVAASWSLPLSEALRSNLADGASYFVSAWAADLAAPANVGGLSAGATAFTWADSAPPSDITDLSALSGSAPGSISLTWTAPGDDGTAGSVLTGEYRVHYSSTQPVSFSTAAAQVVIATASVSPGFRQGAVLTGLEASATYYIRVFFADDSANWSGLSNGATALATAEPFDQIWGHVVKTSSEGITGVLLEAYDALGNVVASTRTVNDSSGTYKLRGVPAGTFKVQATWTAGDITSSVWLDGIAQGSVNVDFILEINYTLSTLTGTLASLSAQAASPAGFLARAAEDSFRQSRIELLQNGRPIAETSPDPTGRWTISNLLPGRYAVRAFNGLEYTEPQEVQLGEGETQEVVFVFDPLPEAQTFAFPNPARDRTTFRFVSGLPGLEAQVSVFDIAGVLVKEIPGSTMVPKPGGLYHAAWDLTNDRGEPVASGVYLFMVKVRGANGQAGKVIKKLAVVR